MRANAKIAASLSLTKIALLKPNCSTNLLTTSTADWCASLFGTTFAIPGYLVWAALLYAMVGDRLARGQALGGQLAHDAVDEEGLVRLADGQDVEGPTGRITAVRGVERDRDLARRHEGNPAGAAVHRAASKSH